MNNQIDRLEMPVIHTERLRLRKLTLDDANDLFEYASDPMMCTHTTWSAHVTLADSQFFIQLMLDQYATRGPSNYALESLDTGKMIGTCGFVDWDEQHSRVELGYALARTHWGQGFMSEAVASLMDEVYMKSTINRIEARCLTANEGSKRVMQKAGMSYEGTLRQHMCIRGSFEDILVYAKLRKDWNKSDSFG